MEDISISCKGGKDGKPASGKERYELFQLQLFYHSYFIILILILSQMYLICIN